MNQKLRVVAAVAVTCFMVAAGSSSYVVNPGDSLSKIADEFDTSVSALAEANDISNPDRIFIGQELLIPGIDTAEPGAGTHIVQRGDTLDSIARKHGTTAAVIAAANGITNPGLIYVGTQLRLTPVESTFAPEQTSQTSYVVAPGDTLGGIAARYGTTVARLVQLNNIANPNFIKAGAILTVEGAGWVCPVPGATFFNDWGFPRSGGRFHEGNDLFAPRGTPVLAPVSGTLTQVVGTIGGYQFRLEGDDEHLYIGTHLDRFGKDGRVLAGEVVGYVGDSGNARGSRPHLHFEILADGENTVNPYPTLSEACG